MALSIKEAHCPRYNKCHSHTLHGTQEVCDIDGLALTPEEKVAPAKGTGDDFLFVLCCVICFVGFAIPAIKHLLQ